jgi:CRT-like, chloroquine-resistance transporter-like
MCFSALLLCLFRSPSTANHWYAVALVLGSSIPLSCVVVYMERVLKDAEKYLQVLYLWFWLNVFEFICVWPLVLAIVPIQGVPVAAIPENLRDGFLCLIWGDEAVHNSDSDHVHKYGFTCPEGSTLPYYFTFIAVLVLTKALLGYVVQHESSSIMWLSAVASIPISEGIFCLEFISGKDQCAANWNTWVGLVVVILGLVAYRWERKASGTGDGDREPESV